MKQLTFQAVDYILEADRYIYPKTESSIIGQIELLWAGVCNSRLTELSRRDLKLIKSLKAKIREISIFKDKDQDSRIQIAGVQILLLEESELEILSKLLSNNGFLPLLAEDLDSLWNTIESAREFVPAKPTLVKEAIDK